eukprot:m.164831 g.164831  ORF g.164831 m.164831 type:complete len:806 (+) comp17722_c0_seq8:203-2620(+)
MAGGARPAVASYPALIALVFVLVFAWFRVFLFPVWDLIHARATGWTPAAFARFKDTLHGKMYPEQRLHDQTQFAAIAAGTHVLVLVLGMFAWPFARYLTRSGAPSGDDASSPPATEVTAVAARPRVIVRRAKAVVVALVLAVLFFFTLGAAFQYCFQSRQGFVYRWARAFFYDDADTPFRVLSAGSYTVCLLCGMLFQVELPHQAQVPDVVLRWVSPLFTILLAAFLFFSRVAIPLWNSSVHPLLMAAGLARVPSELTAAQSETDETSQTQQQHHQLALDHSFAVVATATHTMALVFGMGVCYLHQRGSHMLQQLTDTVPSEVGMVLSGAGMLCFWLLPLSLYAFMATWLSDVFSDHFPGLGSGVSFVFVSYSLWVAWGYMLLEGHLPIPSLMNLLNMAWSAIRDTRVGRILHKVGRVCVVVLFYNTEKVALAFVISSLVFATIVPYSVVTGWLLIAAVYIHTFANGPSRSGWRCLQDVDGHPVFDELATYFDFRVIAEDTLNPDEQHILGYHPHGVFPASLGWMHLTSRWQEKFPNIRPGTLVSSVLHLIPVVRDVAQLFRGYDVSKESFLSALDKERSVFLVPGGQMEMIKSKSASKSIYVYSKHRGFVRLALQYAAANKRSINLVPTFCFGESLILDNAPTPYSWQLLSVKRLRANIFFFPYGACGFPGVPRPLPLTLVVGKAIKVPVVDRITEDIVDLLQRRYYTALQQLFDKHRSVIEGHGGYELDVFPPVNPLIEADFLPLLREKEREASKLPTEPVAPKRTSPTIAGVDPDIVFVSAFWITVFGVILYFAATHAEQAQ